MKYKIFSEVLKKYNKDITTDELKKMYFEINNIKNNEEIPIEKNNKINRMLNSYSKEDLLKISTNENKQNIQELLKEYKLSLYEYYKIRKYCNVKNIKIKKKIDELTKEEINDIMEYKDGILNCCKDYDISLCSYYNIINNKEITKINEKFKYKKQD